MYARLFCINMWNLIIVFLALCSCVFAVTEEELKLELTKLVIKCNKNSEVDMSELLLLQRFVVPTKTKTKCVLACAYKTAGVMTEDGLYNIEYAYKIAEQIKNGDENRVVNAKKMADVCVKVNDAKVSDAEKGCDRATLIFTCIAENAPKFGFKL